MKSFSVGETKEANLTMSVCAPGNLVSIEVVELNTEGSFESKTVKEARDGNVELKEPSARKSALNCRNKTGFTTWLRLCFSPAIQPSAESLHLPGSV